MLSQTTPHSTDTIVRRIRAEYWEMPDLKLTAAQAQRLWDLDGESCAKLLADLVMSGYLVRTRDGAYVRRDPGFVR